MWLLQQSVLNELQAAREAGFSASPEQITAHISAMGSGGSRVMAVAGDKAEIKIRGVLTEEPDFMAFLFGGGNTTYSEVRAALADAQADPDVEEIVLNIDSPGGTVAGLFDTLDALDGTSKPVVAKVSNMAASAAYALASAADTIVAGNVATQLGSVGTAKRFQVDSDTVVVTSTNAPDKIPDVRTEAGVATVRTELDGMHTLFVESIAAGRGTTAEKVNESYGRGAVLLAGDALERGMIDSIASVESAKTSTAALASGNNPKVIMMDRTKLQAEHPELVTALVQEGVTQERDRVGAHLTMGSASGDMTTAIAAVNDGSEMTATLQATYMAAAMNKSSVEARAEDDTAADPGTAPAAPAESDDKAQAQAGLDAIMLAAGNACGVTVEV